MSNTSSMTSVQDVLKCLHKHGVQGNAARMEVVNMLDHKQVNTNYWYSPESITKQVNDTIKWYLTGLFGEVPELKKAMLSKLKIELNKAEDRVVIYLADEVIGHIFWCNDTYNLCWEAHNTKNPEQQFETWKFSGHFDLATLMKKITTVVEAISNGDCKVMPLDETDEYVINSRKEYDAVITKIKAHFDDEDRCGEYDIASSIEEEKQYHRASLAYIKYLEETLANTQSLVIAYGEKITEQQDFLPRMCARLGKMGNLAYLNALAKLSEVYGDKEGALRAAIKKEQWKGVECKCKETVEWNNRPIELDGRRQACQSKGFRLVLIYAANGKGIGGRNI